MESYTSPQTGSSYQVVNTGAAVVSYRAIDDGQFRVRIQADIDTLQLLLPQLSTNWGGVKGEDHLSVTVTGRTYCARAIGQAVTAIVATL